MGTPDTVAGTPRKAVRSTYLALPSRDLTFLKNTLRLYLREDKVAEVVQAFGARCGAGQVIQSQVEIADPKDLAEVVPAMCAQIGLAKLKTRTYQPGVLVLELSRIAEGAMGGGVRGGRFDFTGGFLQGAVEQMIGCRVVGKALAEETSADGAVFELRWNPASVVVASGAKVAAPAATVVPTSPSVPPAGGPRPPPSGAYFWEEEAGRDPVETFVRLARAHGGLAITADRGRELRARRELAHLSVYDLSAKEATSLLTLEAGNLPALLSTVDEFVKHNPGSVVLLTDLPMLLDANGVEPTRNLLRILAEMVAEGKGTLIAAAPSGALPAGERSHLLRVLKVYTTSA